MHNRARLFLVVLIVASVVGAGLAYYVVTGPAKPSPSPPAGPEFQVSVNMTSLTDADLTPAQVFGQNSSVQVFSVVPSAESYVASSLEGQSLSTNPFVELLFNSSLNADGVAKGRLSTEFNAIAQAWSQQAQPLTTNVSLQVYVTLNSIVGGSDRAYVFYNNIPYNPQTPASMFFETAHFASQPTLTASVSPSATETRTPLATRSAGQSCEPGFYWTFTNQTYVTNADLPLALLDATTAPSPILVSDGVAFATIASMEFSFNSVAAYVT